MWISEIIFFKNKLVGKFHFPLLRLLLFSLICSIDFQVSSQTTNEKADTSILKGYNDGGYQNLHLSRPLKRQDLVTMGLQIIRQLDSQNYIVKVPVNFKSNQVKSLNYNFTLATDQWKLSNGLARINVDGNAKGQFSIKVLDIDAFKDDMLKNGIPVIIMSEYKEANSIIIETTYKAVFDQIIKRDNTIFVESFYGKPQEESDVIDHNITVNKINRIYHQNQAINGKDITISIKENKYDTADIDFKGRHIASSSSSSSVSQHATDMASIIAGGGNSSFKSKGVAWGANITSSDFATLFPDEDKYYRDLAVSVQNHSYGTNIESVYGILANAYDVSANNNPSLIHVFSIGNDGQKTDTTGPYKRVNTFANITGNYKQAKNIITVGALDLTYKLDTNISKGPAYDGRIKPEVVAYSTFGSSNSAAIVSGIVTLMQQLFKMNNSETLPPAALIKAILCNSADDVGHEGIDYYSGFGNVNAFRAVNDLMNKQYFAGTLSQNENKYFELIIPANVKNLKITLVWNDPAANPNDSKALVNDLDLELVQNTTGQIWAPWVLNPYPNADSLKQLPQRKADRLNNIEQISLASPEAGIYKINVKAYDIAVSPQDFFIAYQWDDDNSFTWTFPTGNDNLLYFNKGLSTLRWESTFPANEVGKLEVSYDKGNTWQLIDNAVTLSNGFYYWQFSKAYTTSLMRMTILDKAFVTDTFLISSPLEMKVGFNCSDSVMLKWDRVKEAVSYTLYSLGNKYMEPILALTDTAVVLQKSTYPSVQYAVSPTLPGDFMGIRSPAYDYGLQGAQCYFIGFLANSIKKGVQLSLELGTTYKILRIDFETWGQQGFQTIETITPVNSNLQTYLHDTPKQGINLYRVRIEFDNGLSLISNVDTVYYLSQALALVFPNPIKQNEELTICTQYDMGKSAIFKLIDMSGRVLFIKQLISDQEKIILSSINRGIYIYSMEIGNALQTGKIVVF